MQAEPQGAGELLAASEQPAADAAPREVARQWRRLGPDGPSLASPDTGFAELGERAPLADGGGAQPGGGKLAAGDAETTAQLLSYRTFWPGQSYTPDVRSRPEARKAQTSFDVSIENPRKGPNFLAATVLPILHSLAH